MHWRFFDLLSLVLDFLGFVLIFLAFVVPCSISLLSAKYLFVQQCSCCCKIPFGVRLTSQVRECMYVSVVWVKSP